MIRADEKRGPHIQTDEKMLAKEMNFLDGEHRIIAKDLAISNTEH